MYLLVWKRNWTKRKQTEAKQRNGTTAVGDARNDGIVNQIEKRRLAKIYTLNVEIDLDAKIR